MILPGLFGGASAVSLSRTTPGSYHPSDSNLPGWLVDSPSTSSGIEVGTTGALRASTVFAAVRLIADVSSTLPLQTFRRGADDSREIAERHLVRELLAVEPNPEQTASSWRSQLIAHQLLWGNHFAEIERDKAGRPAWIWPIHPPSRVSVRRVGVRKRRLVYEVTREQEGKKRVKLRAEDVLHFPNTLSLDGIVGQGLVDLAREAIGMAMATERHGSLFFGNYQTPTGYLKHPGRFKDPAAAGKRIRAQMDAVHGGDGRHRLAVLEEGMEFVKMGYTAEEAQFLETRRFQVGEIARYFGVPPHLLMDLERATFSNIEEQDRGFLKYFLRPRLVKIEQELERKLFRASERRRYFVRHNVDALLRGNTQTRYGAHAIGLQNGFLSQNEVRKIEDLNPIEGGDVYRTPLNLGDSAGSEEEPPPDPADEAQPVRSGLDRASAAGAFEVLFADVFARAIRRETRAIEKGAPRALASGTLADWARTFYAEHRGVLALFLDPLCEAWSSLMAVPCDAEDLAGAWCAYSERNLVAVVEADAPAERLTELLDEWLSTRPAEYSRGIITLGDSADAA